MKLYSSRKLYIHNDKCWTGSTKVYRQDDVDEVIAKYEALIEKVIDFVDGEPIEYDYSELARGMLDELDKYRSKR